MQCSWPGLSFSSSSQFLAAHVCLFAGPWVVRNPLAVQDCPLNIRVASLEFICHELCSWLGLSFSSFISAHVHVFACRTGFARNPLASRIAHLACNRHVRVRSVSVTSCAPLKILKCSRALELQVTETPLTASSLPSTPGSGANRMHPYGRIGEVSANTSYEVVSSVTTQAPAAPRVDNSMEATPIARPESLPALSTPIHVPVSSTGPTPLLLHSAGSRKGTSEKVTESF